MEGAGQVAVPSASRKQRHGLACVPCAAAKTKCLRTHKSSNCERCVQLKKQCTSRIPMPRKRKSGPPTTARVAQLEQKLDGLVTLLTSQPPVTGEEDNAVDPTIHSKKGSSKLLTPDDSASAISDGHVMPLSEARHAPSRPRTDSMAIDASRLLQSMTSSDALSLQIEDGRTLLDLFYTKILPYFPFAVLQPNETADWLKKQKPFLWNVIRCIAMTRDRKKQEALGAEIMQEISSKLLLTSPHTTKSLGLLQGILLFAAWNHHQFAVNGQMSALLYLSRTLVVFLGLDKPKGAIDRHALWIAGSPLRTHTAKSVDQYTHCVAEQRAFLAFYYLAMARVKMAGKHADIFQYTPYIEKCCQSLEANQECRSDVLLVYLVRIQSIVQEINQTFPYDEIETFKALGTPVALCIKALRTKLSTLRSSLPLELEHDPLFLMTYYSAELSIYEVALYHDAPEVEAPNVAFHLHLDRLSLLYGCLMSLVAYFDTYTQLPQEDAIVFPFTIWMQSGLAMLTGVELEFLQLDGWDATRVREAIDMTKILDREIKNLEEIAAKRQTHPQDDTKKDVFWRFAARMRKTRELYDTKMNVEFKNGLWTEGSAGNDIDMSTTVDGILAGDLFNDWDDSYWQSFVSDQWNTMGMLGNEIT